jgi:hypothetical protein
LERQASISFLISPLARWNLARSDAEIVARL